MKRRSILGLGVLVAVSLGSGVAFADHHEADEAGEAAGASSEASSSPVCFDLSRVNTTKVIDRQTVLVTMRGNDQYKITTVNRCSGLTKNRGVIFDLKGASRRVCPIDMIKGSVTGSLSSGMIVSCPIDTIEKVEQAAEQPAE